MLSEPILVVAKLAGVFDALGIRYVVGGSVASSIYGVPRATQDVDLVADVRLSHVDAITSALAAEFYVDADMIRDAIKQRASFNVVHLATMFKADVFILQGDSWSREESHATQQAAAADRATRMRQSRMPLDRRSVEPSGSGTSGTGRRSRRSLWRSYLSARSAAPKTTIPYLFAYFDRRASRLVVSPAAVAACTRRM
jgi:hypothetical protein